MIIQYIGHMAVCAVWPACIYVRMYNIYDHILNPDLRETSLVLTLLGPNYCVKQRRSCCVP